MRLAHKSIAALVCLRSCRSITMTAAHQMLDYDPIPSDMVLKHVVVIHRHGDRSQISPSLGPTYPENAEITNLWKSKMPTDSTSQLLLKVAKEEILEKEKFINLESSFYSGADKVRFPYGQLTQHGSDQLIRVGQILRDRYQNLLPKSIGEAHDSIYCRSTNMCRTIQSVRSLLVGLLNITPQDSNFPVVPTIFKRKDKSTETLYPEGPGCNPYLDKKQAETLPQEAYKESISDYLELESKMKSLLGYQEIVDWETIREVLNCYNEHGIDFPPGVDKGDLKKVAVIAGWVWGKWFKNESFNRLAIGRFFTELLSDIRSAMFYSNFGDSDPSAKLHKAAKSFLIYSGHDSTVVPTLAALGIYDDIWPDYASHITIEIAQSTKNNQEHFVRVLYNNEMKHILGHNSSYWCPMEIFEKKLQALSITSEQYRKECQIENIK